MKKFLSVLCIGICLLGLTACEPVKPVAPEDADMVMEISGVLTHYILPEDPQAYSGLSMNIGTNVEGLDTFVTEGAEYTEYIFGRIGMQVEGNGFISGVDSWKKAVAEAGQLVTTGEGTVKYGSKGDTLIVDIPAQFENRDAEIEFVYKDDLSKTLTSFAVNINYSFGEKMEKAGLNTLLGMGTVFIVLILLSLLIGSFNFINKAQSAAEKRKLEGAEQAAPAQNEPAAPAAQTSSDDDEITAVIAAAIAAYQADSGISPAESGGYYVRSIRRRTNNKWNRN
ncbi:MAG: OadG family protein [Lachnospiraceae bacterium]|nr:OadG family protein [Lachnospiraceae bacterium]